MIRPPEALRIGHTEKNPAELERVYRIGRRTMEERMESLEAFFQNRKDGKP